MKAPPTMGHSTTDCIQSIHTTGMAVPAEMFSQVLCLLGNEIGRNLYTYMYTIVWLHTKPQNNHCNLQVVCLFGS